MLYSNTVSNNLAVTSPKVALVHDYLREYGGAERVLEALHQVFPEAPVYVGFIDQRGLGDHMERFKGWNIKSTWLQKLPCISKMYSPLRIVAGSAFADLKLDQYDIVISSNNAYMRKAVHTRGKHLSYCHTPPRSLYGYATHNSLKNPFVKVGGALINHYMRVVDYYAAQKVDQFIANSVETQRRIAKFYRRESVVINPPVLMARSQNKPITSNLKRNYFLYVNRLTSAKHPELAIQACIEQQLPLKVVGTGPMFNQLARMAAPHVHIELLGSVSDDELSRLYADAIALLYPVEDEDFGIVPIEAMSFGTPVIAHASGGPLETIVAGVSGLFFEELTVASLLTALKRFSETSFDPEKVMATTQKYSMEHFKQQLVTLLKL